MSSKFLKQTFSYAMDIDDLLQKKYEYSMSPALFNDLVVVLQYPKTLVGIRKFYNVLEKLSPQDLEKRINQVSSLIKALTSIKKNKR